MDIYYKYNGKYGSFEVNCTHKKINDALQWGIIAEESKGDSHKFIKILRRILNELFEDGKMEYAIKNEKDIIENISEYLRSERQIVEIAVEIIHDHQKSFTINLKSNNDSEMGSLKEKILTTSPK